MGSGFGRRESRQPKQAEKNKIFLTSRKAILLTYRKLRCGRTSNPEDHEILQGRFSSGGAGFGRSGTGYGTVTGGRNYFMCGQDRAAMGYLKAGEVGTALRRLPLPGGLVLSKIGELFSPVDFHLGEHCRVLVHSMPR